MSTPGPTAATPAAARVGQAGAGVGLEAGEGGGASQDTVVHPPAAPPRGDGAALEGDELEADEVAADRLEGDRLEGDELAGDRLEGDEFEFGELEGDELGRAAREDEDHYDESPSDARVDDLEDEDYEGDFEEPEPRPGAGTATPPPSRAATPRPIPPLPPSPAAIPRPPPPPRTIAATPAGARPQAYRGGVRPPSTGSRPDAASGPGGVFSSRGRAVLLICAAVVGLSATTYGGLQLGDGDDGAAEPAGGQGDAGVEPAGGGAGGGAGEKKRSVIDPASVTVSILNGTTVQGLAAKVGDSVEQQRFQLGTVSNFTDQERAESVVLYAAGAEREAAEVGRRLKIAQREPIDPSSQAQAGDASVVVVVGGDKSD